jgi:hypothetical protein
VNAQALADLSQGETIGQHRGRSCGVDGVDCGASEVSPSCTRAAHPGHHTLADQVTLELSHRRQDVEQEAS